MVLVFFKDECVFIDIAEKNKIMFLEGHNQEKEKSQLDSTQASRIGTSTTQATQHNSKRQTMPGRIGTSTRMMTPYKTTTPYHHPRSLM